MNESIKQLDNQSGVSQSRRMLTNISSIRNKILSPLIRVLVLIGSAIVMAMMFLITADVIGRNFLHEAIKGTDELIGMFLVCVAACAFAYAQNEKGHIRMTVFTGRMSPRAQMFLDIFAYLVALVMTSFIFWRSLIYIWKLALNLQAGSSGTFILHIPFLPFWTIFLLGFLILWVILLFDIIQKLLTRVK